MKQPNKHSITRNNLSLKKGSARIVLLFRGIYARNIRQMQQHLLKCKNNDDDLEYCECHLIQ